MILLLSTRGECIDSYYAIECIFLFGYAALKYIEPLSNGSCEKKTNDGAPPNREKFAF